MRCARCGRKFKGGEDVIPMLTYVVNEKRGDFVTNNPVGYLHASHVGEQPGVIG